MTHSTTVSELLPCPFCGVSPFADVQNGACGPTGQVQFVWCEKCDGRGPERYNEADAITAWNTRAKAQGSEAVAVIRFNHGPGTENDMPTVVSCDWRPNGDYPLYASPPVQAQPQGLMVKKDSHGGEGDVE